MDEGEQLLSMAEALGSRWAANLAAVIILLPLSIVLVIVQETATPNATPAFLAVTSITQFVIGYLPVLAVIVLRRTRTDLIPVPSAFALWATTGILHGITGGLIAAWMIDAPPDFAIRIAFWLTLALIWMPVFVYAMAQFEHRRYLFGTLDTARRLLDDELERHQNTTERLRAQLIGTVRDAVAPVVVEIRRSLAAIATELSPAVLQELGGKIAVVARDAARIIDDADRASHTASTTPAPVSVSRAIYFEPGAPIATALLTGVLLSPLSVPVSFRISPVDGGATVIGLCVMMIVLAALLSARRLLPEREHERGIAFVFASSATAGIAGLVAMALAHGGSEQPFNLPLALSFPVAIVSCSAFLSSVLGVAHANAALAREIESIRGIHRAIAAESDAEEAIVRAQLSTVLHGPVQGRLSACVMALNFYASDLGENAPERTSYITTAVLGHLDAAAADLDELAGLTR